MSHSQKLRLIVVVVILFFGLFFLLGKTRLVINPLVRKLYLNKYLDRVQKENSLNPESFWEFRDFMSSGAAFEFNDKNIPQGKPFLKVTRSWITSSDLLTPLKNMPDTNQDICPNPMIPCAYRTILKTEDEVIYAAGGRVYIEFIKPYSELQKANGFFVYFHTDTKPYQNYYWYNRTIIEL